LSTEPTREEIQRRAYFLYVARDRQHGADLDDWLQAEQQAAAAEASARPKPRPTTKRTARPRTR
jgi:hypothetical protein